MKKTTFVTKVGMLAAVAVILQYLGSYIGLKVGGFLDVEISDYPAILGTLSMGPAAGVAIELIKNLIHLAISGTGFVGELANFLITGTFVLVIGLVYAYNRTKKGAVLALILGVIAIVAAGIVFNTCITLPFYEKLGFIPPMTVPQRLLSLVLPVITPFNLVKGIVLALLTLVTYKPLSPLLKKGM